MLDSLFSQFDRVLALDTETTGFSPKNDEIIELAVLCQREEGDCSEYDEFIRLSPGRRLPEKIRELTGITEEMLASGVEKRQAAEALAAMLREGRPLVVAYNAQFDLGFLYYFLRRFALEDALRNARFLDAMTVYKDRRPYPHKLCDAVTAYALQGENTHRAIDDTRATLELLLAMGEEKDDLDRYVNLFGYPAKYGVSGQRVASIRYFPQSGHPGKPLYEKAAAPVLK